MEAPENPELVVPETAYEQQALSEENSPGRGLASTGGQAGADIWPEYCNPAYVMPEIIEIKVAVGEDHYFFPLTVVKAATNSKLYVGGYRHKVTGKIYHHASTQTPTERQSKKEDTSHLRTRETQTVETRTVSIQGQRESGTQMERVDLRLNNARDVVKYARNYTTSDEVFIIRKASAITMQRYWRGYMARVRASGIRKRNVEYKEQQRKQQEETQEAEEQRRTHDMMRRTHPKSNQDFAVLYNELDTWRRAEMAKIKASVSDPEERRRAMTELLNNETKALQSLQQLKAAAQKELHHERTEEMLRQMSQPLQWQLSHGETAFVHTHETQRAKQLLDLFHSLHQPLMTADQRLQVLLSVKWMVSEVDAAITDEIRELVDREADLISRNRPAKSMERLRLRLSNLVLQFLQNPEYNPRAADFIKEKI